MNNNHKFLLTDNLNNNINNSKINKQLQLQSNIFNDENLTKNGNDINKIKQRIQLAEKSNETKPKNHFFHFKTTSNILTEKTDDKNIWGSLHNNWEKYNIDWLKDNTEIVFNKNSLNKDDNITAFDRKMNQLSDSNYKDTINESIKVNRKNTNIRKRDKYLSNLEQIDEILNDIPTLKYDKKKQILFYSNTTGLNGESNIDKNLTNYNKYHKINLDKKVKKEPTIKIMSKESQNHIDNKKKEQKYCSNLNKYDTNAINQLNSLITSNVVVFFILSFCLIYAIYKISINIDIEFISSKKYPVNATEYILNNVDYKNMRIYNDYNVGSYLMLNNIPVFIDSRLDVYCSEFNNTDIFKDYINITYDNQYYDEIFKKYDFTHILLKNDEKVLKYIKKDTNYSIIYEDEYFTLFERN